MCDPGKVNFEGKGKLNLARVSRIGSKEMGVYLLLGNPKLYDFKRRNEEWRWKGQGN